MALINSQIENYYTKLIELQEKLRRSEEERLKLEMRYNELNQQKRNDEHNHISRLRAQYQRFLEEDRKRQDRNERILRCLDRIDGRISLLTTKTRRFRELKHQYSEYLSRIYQQPIQSQAKPLRKYLESVSNEELHNLLQNEGMARRRLEQNMQSADNREIDAYNIGKNDYPILGTNSNKTQHKTQIENIEVSNAAKGDFGMYYGLHDEEIRPNYANTIADKIMNSIYTNNEQKLDYKDCKEVNTESGEEVIVERPSFEVKPVVFSNLDKTPKDNNDNQVKITETNKECLEEEQLSARFEETSLDNLEIEKTVRNFNESQLLNQNVDDEICFETLKTFENLDDLYLNDTTDLTIESQKNASLDKIDTFLKDKDTKVLNDVFNVNKKESQEIQDDISSQPILQETEQVQPETDGRESQKQESNESQANDISFGTLENNDRAANLQEIEQDKESKIDESNVITPGTKNEVDEYGETKKEPNLQPEIEAQYPQNLEYDQSQQYYDENGQFVDQYYENGQLINQYQPQYDDNGQIINQYNESGELLPQYSQYDANGQLLSQYQAQYDENGELVAQYDDNGQIIINQYEQEHDMYAHYDENGQLINGQYDENGQLMGYEMKQQMSYDENGQVLPEYEQHYDQSSNKQGEQPEIVEENSNFDKGKVTELSFTQKQNDTQELNEKQKVLEENQRVDEKLSENNYTEEQKAPNIIQMLDTDSESQNNVESKISNDSDFDFSNKI